MKIANYDKAEQFHLLALNKLIINKEHDILPVVYNKLGYISNKNGHQEKAIEYYKKSVHVNMICLLQENTKRAEIHNKLDMINYQQDDYDKILSNHTEASQLNLIPLIPDDTDIAEAYKCLKNLHNC